MRPYKTELRQLLWSQLYTQLRSERALLVGGAPLWSVIADQLYWLLEGQLEGDREQDGHTSTG